jgi:hypothetical protein
VQRVAIAVTSFTIVAGAWLSAMYLVLRHDGYWWRLLISLAVVGLGLATLRALRRPPSVELKTVLIVGALALGTLGVSALWQNNGPNAHFEGFVAVIGLAFVVQAALMLLTFLRPRHMLPPGTLR